MPSTLIWCTIISGDADSVLKAMDEFGYQRFLMNVGDSKGIILTDLIKTRRPKVVLELG